MQWPGKRLVGVFVHICIYSRACCLRGVTLHARCTVPVSWKCVVVCMSVLFRTVEMFFVISTVRVIKNVTITDSEKLAIIQ